MFECMTVWTVYGCMTEESGGWVKSWAETKRERLRFGRKPTHNFKRSNAFLYVATGASSISLGPPVPWRSWICISASSPLMCCRKSASWGKKGRTRPGLQYLQTREFWLGNLKVGMAECSRWENHTFCLSLKSSSNANGSIYIGNRIDKNRCIRNQLYSWVSLLFTISSAYNNVRWK